MSSCRQTLRNPYMEQLLRIYRSHRNRRSYGDAPGALAGLIHGGGSKMLSEHGSAPRRRKSRASRFAVPLAIPAALGVTFGVVMAISHGGAATTVAESALGTCASASASAAASPPATAATASAPAPAPARAS